MIVIGAHLLVQPQMAQQLGGDAAVLHRHDVRGLQYGRGAGADISQVADWRGHDIDAGFEIFLHEG